MECQRTWGELTKGGRDVMVKLTSPVDLGRFVNTPIILARNDIHFATLIACSSSRSSHSCIPNPSPIISPLDLFAPISIPSNRVNHSTEHKSQLQTNFISV